MIRTFMCNHVGHRIKIIRPIVVNQKFVRIRQYSVRIPQLTKESEPTNNTAGNTCLKDNPFFHTIKFSKKHWALTLATGVVLVPSRLALLTLLIAGAWVPYIFTLKVIKPEFTKMEQQFHRQFYRTVLRICGIRFQLQGKLCSVEESRIIVCAPHTSIFEWFTQMEGLYTNIAGANSKDWYLLGPVIQRSAIIVDKNERESRQQAQREVQEWFEKREQNPALLPHRLSLTPEGWFTNGSKILNFKTGAFKPGRPVQPVVFKWGSRFAPIMTYGQDMSWFWTVLIQLAVPSTQLTAKILPVYHPNQDEKRDAELFSMNVAQLMAKEAGIPLAEHNAYHYLAEIKKMRASCDDLKLTGWKRLFTSGSELLSEKSTNVTRNTEH